MKIKKFKNLIISNISIVILIIVMASYALFPSVFKFVFYIGLTFTILMILYANLLREENLEKSEYPLMPEFSFSERENLPVKKTEKKLSVSFESVSNHILYSLQMIETALNILVPPNETQEKSQDSILKFIRKNIFEIKKVITLKLYNLDSASEEQESFLEPDIDIQVDSKITQDISIGIFGVADKEKLNLRLILQSYGFFVKIYNSAQETLSSIEENLIQMLIILPESENDASFMLCSKIREKFTLLDFPILLITKPFLNFFAEKNYKPQVNDFLTRPFDVSSLITKIQIFSDQRKLFLEKEELVKSEKEKRIFLYFVTHNVNTPLTVLLNEIETLSQISDSESGGTNENEKILETVKNISESANQINIIIQNVLNSCKISDGKFMVKPKILNLENFVQKENKFLKNKALHKNQNFTVECSDKSLSVFCDENSLKGIYTNLCDNAIKYTFQGGNINVRIDSDGEFVYLKIIDDGQGIPKEKRENLFNRFSKIGSKPTGNENSVGLGLYVVRELCSLNNVEIKYSENTSAKTGSIFTLVFQKIG